ncbi:hypothetical protein BDDG_03126 [Blastomyces dermatitidis ATCC 18188]|nr:hypothetical protein BDDG_03126 [Blastomyces dermatitidis ATCC 18188]
MIALSNSQHALLTSPHRGMENFFQPTHRPAEMPATWMLERAAGWALKLHHPPGQLTRIVILALEHANQYFKKLLINTSSTDAIIQ